jgi:hypothetical protein
VSRVIHSRPVPSQGRSKTKRTQAETGGELSGKPHHTVWQDAILLSTAHLISNNSAHGNRTNISSQMKSHLEAAVDAVGDAWWPFDRPSIDDQRRAVRMGSKNRSSPVTSARLASEWT